LRLFSFGGYGLALAALALVVFAAIECPPFPKRLCCEQIRNWIISGVDYFLNIVFIQFLSHGNLWSVSQHAKKYALVDGGLAIHAQVWVLSLLKQKRNESRTHMVFLIHATR